MERALTPEYQALADELEKALPRNPAVIDFVVRWALGLVEQEREACALEAESWRGEQDHDAQTCNCIATAIRARA